MYACGVTVYDDCHIGHARSLYVFEVIRRYLQHRGFKVCFVRNITDLDDKIIDKARKWAAEQSISLAEAFDKVRNTYIGSYYNDLESLGIPKADFEPRATENIKEMIAYVKKLIELGFAYEVKGSVYFSVRDFLTYGALSGNDYEFLLSWQRIEPDPLKKDPLDFALWKKAKPDEPAWKSPWGDGRPGWHLECSVMSQKYLKTATLDIHGGGRDLIFPHHENERSQSEAFSGKPFARYWIHHGLLTIEKQKMAKSLGNFYTIKEVLAKYPADVLKMLYLQAHYSSPLDFSWEQMDEAKKAYERILILIHNIDRKLIARASGVSPKKYADIDNAKNNFIEAMDDDFNMPKAIGSIFDFITLTNKKIDDIGFIASAKKFLEEHLSILAISLKKQAITSDEIEALISERENARKQKDYVRADQIRKQLDEKGIILEDTKEGPVWRKKI